VKRYEFEQCCFLGDIEEVPHPEGRWVRYEDVKVIVDTAAKMLEDAEYEGYFVEVPRA